MFAIQDSSESIESKITLFTKCSALLCKSWFGVQQEPSQLGLIQQNNGQVNQSVT